MQRVLGLTRERPDFPSSFAAFRWISGMRRRLRGKENREGSKRSGVALRVGIQDRRLIRSLSRLDVEKTLAGLKPFIARSRWLGSTNRYCKDTLAKIKSDASARRIRCPLHLAQYISASSLLHSSDGWSYLGKALLSILRGDPHRAVHLAYYAELRAAVSLLATEGIGIFNNRHFVIDAPGSVARMHGGNSPTHQFTRRSRGRHCSAS